MKIRSPILRCAANVLLLLLVSSCGRKESNPTPADAPEPIVADSATGAIPPRLARPAGVVDAATVRRWMIHLTDRKPPRNALEIATLGDSAWAVRLARPGSSWLEMIDVDANGTLERVTFLEDPVSHVTYAWTPDEVVLADGTSASHGVLVAQFAAARRGRAAGSGWYALGLAPAASGSEEIPLTGCTFDPAGRPDACGPGRWDAAGNEFVLAGSL